MMEVDGGGGDGSRSLKHVQTICTQLQSDRRRHTLTLTFFYRPDAVFLPPCKKRLQPTVIRLNVSLQIIDVKHVFNVF